LRRKEIPTPVQWRQHQGPTKKGPRKIWDWKKKVSGRNFMRKKREYVGPGRFRGSKHWEKKNGGKGGRIKGLKKKKRRAVRGILKETPLGSGLRKNPHEEKKKESFRKGKE